MTDPRLPFEDEPTTVDARVDARDRAGRERAVDPRFNVALEASAGTGKTRVLVDRYVNLLREGVDPPEILALTFTRKAATEMRERILATLKTAAARGDIVASRWRELRDRTADVAISTIDAFCLSLLREFPLEADLDPGFQMADDTEVPRLIDEALDVALRTCRSVARDDEHVALVFAQLGDRRARAGLAGLLARRIVAPTVLERYLAGAPRRLTIADAAARGRDSLLRIFGSMRGGLDRFLETGPLHPSFTLFARQLRELDSTARGAGLDPALVQAAFRQAREHFLTQDGEPRKQMPPRYKKATFASVTDWQVHRDLLVSGAHQLREAYLGYRRDLNVLVARGVLRMFRIAESEYRRTLDARALLDFPDVLLKALELLRQMEEFSQSRFRLEARYHHVLVDEFQDTSRAQWELISLLVEAWGAGAGLAHIGALPPSIFIVGDRKQSIYGFRDADVSLFGEASRYMDSLRPGGDVRRSISRSFRSVQPLLAFVNDLCEGIGKSLARKDAFRYEEQDRFPIDSTSEPPPSSSLAFVVGDTIQACAHMTAAEIVRLIDSETVVRDRETGVHRPIRPADIAILFRTRESHREYEQALEAKGLSAYVYKGLGFFDADETQDVMALLWYLARPTSDLRVAAWLRSRFIRLSDEGLRRIGPHVAAALNGPTPPAVTLHADDTEALQMAREAGARWRQWVDRLPPAELLDRILGESAYAVELRGPRLKQARENLKKIRAIIRRIQNRGYVTVERLVTHLDRLAVGDEANAVIDATDSVSLMTVHAAKGLEFPVVFIVNMSRGTGNWRDAIRISTEMAEEVSVSIGDFESASDEDAVERDREETKRLLYVAVTRARDRLYLGSVVKEGTFQPGRGSLGEVLPESLQDLFGRASEGAPALRWSAASGEHLLSVVAATGDWAVPHAPRRGAAAEPGTDFAPVEDADLQRVTVAAASSTTSGSAEGDDSAGTASNRLIGSLVHRLLQRVSLDSGVTDERLRHMVQQQLKILPEVDGDVESVLDDVVLRMRALLSDAQLRELYRSGRVFHEVPFTMVTEGQILRGTMDCLVSLGPDRVVVLEFKTGRPRPEHDAQAEVYRLAAETLFPQARVEARLVYTSEAGA